MVRNTLVGSEKPLPKPWEMKKPLKNKFESLKIALASPIRIRHWAERTLPNGKKIGRVLNYKTVNYKTLKPESDGLFCEKIFGPINDFECLCGTKKILFKGKSIFCPNCDVEFTASRIRRYRLGYIKLASPVPHIWYLRGRPRFLNILFDLIMAPNKGKVYDIKPIIYGIDALYIPIYRLIKIKKIEPSEVEKEIYLKLGTTHNNQSKRFSPSRSSLNFFTKNQNLVKINGFEKNLEYDFLKKKILNDKSDSPNSVQFFINKKYFTKKLQYFLSTCFNKKNRVFNKQLTKIIRNSYYFNYNIGCLYIIKTFNLSDALHQESGSCSKQQSMSVVNFSKKNKAPILNLNKSKFTKLKKTNFFLFEKKIFLNKKVIKIQNESFLKKKKFFQFKQQKSNFSAAKTINQLDTGLNFTSFTHSGVSLEKVFSKPNSVGKQEIPSIPTNYIYSEKKKLNSYSKKRKLKQGLGDGSKINLKMKIPPFSRMPIFYQFSISDTLNLTQSAGKSSALKVDDARFDRLFMNAKSQLDSYYPIYSRCIFKFVDDDKEKKFEVKELWRWFKNYMTSDSVNQDTVILKYSDRLANRYIIANNYEYKYTKTLLTGTEAVSYWLKKLNFVFLKEHLKEQIQFLDKKLVAYRQLVVMEGFQVKLLKKMIKLRRKVYRLQKLVVYFKKDKLQPEWLMVSILPVLPPNLRPIIQLNANQLAVSDLNQLYKRVLYRNKRVEKYLKKNRQTDSNEILFHQRLLQEAVDALLDNGKGGSQLACSPNGRPFKSLSEILKGKKGRFRQNLLGKRVDYSGRSVIIVGPELKLHECGLPIEMAIELFQPFIIRDLIKLDFRKLADFKKLADFRRLVDFKKLTEAIIRDGKITIVKAKKLIKNQHPIVFTILKKLIKNHPILLNRAPTLHRLGIQAFQPKLVEGRAILLHPLVCPAFNADFDGDQMAVHVPLCFQARAEAWQLMWSRNNLLSPATGEPIIIPSQDMVLGCYYLSTTNSNTRRQILHVLNLKQDSNSDAINKALNKFNIKITSRNSNLMIENKAFLKKKVKQTLFLDSVLLNKYFTNLDQVLIYFSQKKMSLHSSIWVKWLNLVEIENFYEKPVELRVDCYGNITKIYSKYFQNLDNKNTKISQFILTTIGRILLNKIILENIFFN